MTGLEKPCRCPTVNPASAFRDDILTLEEKLGYYVFRRSSLLYRHHVCLL